jgi:DNA polymerase I-like protein with 3'-5' exonuclease and polymerase domains
MRTFSQVLLDTVGSSEMASQFKKDPDFDPHTYFAKQLAKNLGGWDSISQDMKKDLRTRSKACNFGFSGALGVKTFIQFCRGFGLDLSPIEAQGLKNSWFAFYPEVRTYFNLIQSRLHPYSQSATVYHRRSGRFRGDCTFTQCANSPFQGMSADGALNALYLISRECFDTSSDDLGLLGSRPVMFIHDEIILETPIEKVHRAGYRLCRLMEEGMTKFVPDIPIKASPIAMSRWSKNAEPVFDSSGKLVPWRESIGQVN